MVVKLYGMSDIGTRMEHLAELQDLWGMALGMLTAGTYRNEQEVAQAREVETALKLLAYHMQSEYDATWYARTINALPIDPKDIKE